MPGDRSRRVGEQIQRYLSSKLIPALRDPRLGFATITAVDVSKDLKTARVFVTIYDQDEGRRKLAFRALEGASGRFRHMIARDLSLRHTPVLSFHEDVSIDRADRIERLIRDIKAHESGESGGTDEADDAETDDADEVGDTDDADDTRETDEADDNDNADEPDDSSDTDDPNASAEQRGKSETDDESE